MRNHSNKKRFDLHENGREGGRHFHMNGFARRFIFKRRQKVTRSLCSAAGIETSFRLQHRKSAIHGLIVKSEKSDWLKDTERELCASSCLCSEIGNGQSSRTLMETRRIAGSGDENDQFKYSSSVDTKSERLGANLTLLGTKTSESLDTKS